jgi:hypothetical protein
VAKMQVRILRRLCGRNSIGRATDYGSGC